jgi:ElaB/YqjD/DUF883 family membrane-anchored ribosome-binding protein
MAQTTSKTQLPIGMDVASGVDEAGQMFEQGLALGREWAQTALDRSRRWAQENPGQFLIVGLAAGFVLGKLLFSSRSDD